MHNNRALTFHKTSNLYKLLLNGNDMYAKYYYVYHIRESLCLDPVYLPTVLYYFSLIGHITRADNAQPSSDTTTPRPLHTIDQAFLAAFALQCARQSADPLSAQVTVPSWNTSFKSEIGGIGIFTRIGPYCGSLQRLKR